MAPSAFERYAENRPWVAYRQFCQHFLAPLALMAHTDIGLGQLLRVYLDGIPLPLAGKLLPSRTRWNLGLGLHIHLHARSQRRHANTPEDVHRGSRVYRRRDLEALLASLEATVRKLHWREGNTEWADCYQANNNYGETGLRVKEDLVKGLLSKIGAGTVWDFGANTGRFSRVATAIGARTVVAWDIDPSAVELNYRQVIANREMGLFPLLLDLTNPSPAAGWAHAERSSLLERGPADAVLALGLVHHLAISNNVPLSNVAKFLACAGRSLIVEWIPKEDSQVQRLLTSRKDIFPDYTQRAFEESFSRFFSIDEVCPVNGTSRTLYRMKGRP